MIKAMCAAYTTVKIMPTGGISAKNIKEYLACDKIFCCGGSWMVKGDMIKAGEFDKIKEILADQLDIEENAITPDSLLVEDLGADSLDAIDIVMSVEDEFGIEVPDEIIEKIESVSDIITFVENNA